MSRRIFHLLTEDEPFSCFHGGAISRWVGNTTADDTDTVVLCSESDGSWGFSTSRVRVLPGLMLQRTLPKKLGRKLPWPMNKHLLRRAIGHGLRDLGAGDIVWIHNRINFAAAVAPYIRRRKAHLILHMHNSHVAVHSKRILGQVRADRTLFCSAFLEAEALAYWPTLGETAPIPNGADDKLFFPASDGHARRDDQSLVVLFVGRLIPEKGAHVLIEAMRILQQRHVPVQARIAGSASFGSNHATAYVEDLLRDPPSNVEFLGYADPGKLGERFREADIFCCPSTWNEPFGMTNVEAMATRMPVIATRCGGIPEIFSEGGALLVEPNSPTQIADACVQLVSNPVLRERLAEEGYISFSKNYNWRAIHRQYRGVVKGLWG